MKSYTDLEQSKKLTEILSTESADTIWDLTNPDLPTIRAIPYEDSDYRNKYLNIMPCWSLAALLNVIPKHTDLCKSSSNENKDIIAYWCYNFPNNLTTECYDNPVDACVAMIEKLHELKML